MVEKRVMPELPMEAPAPGIGTTTMTSNLIKM